MVGPRLIDNTLQLLRIDGSDRHEFYCRADIFNALLDVAIAAKEHVDVPMGSDNLGRWLKTKDDVLACLNRLSRAYNHHL